MTPPPPPFPDNPPTKAAARRALLRAARAHRARVNVLLASSRGVAGNDGTAGAVLQAFMDAEAAGIASANDAIDAWNSALGLERALEDASKAAKDTIELARDMQTGS